MHKQRITPLAVACGLHLAAIAGGSEFSETALFVSGTDGYHTYRIPAIVESTNGTLLAFCEGRKTSSSDAGDIDLVLKRSTDAGGTWDAMRLVQEEGGTAAITIGNPAPVVDRDTGRIWLAFCRNNSRVFLTWSDDDGLSWAERREITDEVKDADWGWYATGPVHGIQLERGPHAGRLLIPCDHIAGGNVWGSHVIYSDDHGANWAIGGSVDEQSGYRPNECVAVELTNAAVHLNSRNHGGQKRRVFAISSDGGETFGAAAADDTLIEPVVQASAVRYSAVDRGGATNLLLFSNPATTTSRTRMTVRRSYDEAETWDSGKLAHAGPSAYSDLVTLRDGRVGLLYEKGNSSPYETIAFARFDLSYLDEPEPPDALPSRALWELNEKEPGQDADLAADAIRDTHPDGHGLHMTAEDAIAYTTGDPRYGGTPALAFTGIQRLRITDAATTNRLDFGADDSFTLEAVIRVPDGSTQTGNIVGKDVAANQPSWWFRVENGHPRFLVCDGPNQPNVTSARAVNDGQWHHIAAVRDRAAGLLRVYVDYQEEGSNTDTTVGSLANGNAATIGMYNNGNRAFTGDIDWVRISTGARRPDQFVTIDHDQDGLPTLWEENHRLDPYDDGSSDPAQGPGGDPDGDRASNWSEYVAGTSPTNAASCLQIELVCGAGRSIHTAFPTASNRSYAVDMSADLRLGAWAPLTNNVPGTGGRMLIKDSTSVGASSRHYRVRVRVGTDGEF